MTKPKVGVSACLLGQPVRYDGASKRQDWIVESLSKVCELEAICPEMAMGLGVPRPAMRLVSDDPRSQPKLVTTKDGKDVTAKAIEVSQRLLEKELRWDGYILKKNSPSCGIERVKIYNESGIPGGNGSGIFARCLIERYPLLPVIEEGRLADEEQRAQFMLRVYAFHRLKQVAPKMADIQNFHRSYKFTLLEHSPALYKKLGGIAGNLEKKPASKVLEEYGATFMQALEKKPTPGKRANVMEHMLGFLKASCSENERRQIHEAIADYRDGNLPFVAPLTLLYHAAKRDSVRFLCEQFFFHPYPKELKLCMRL